MCKKFAFQSFKKQFKDMFTYYWENILYVPISLPRNRYIMKPKCDVTAVSNISLDSGDIFRIITLQTNISCLPNMSQ